MHYPVSVYGILISTAILVCILIVEKRAKDLGKAPSIVWDLATTAILSGLIGARIYHVLDYWQYYSAQPSKVFHFWEGGLGIWGGIFGAFLGISIYLKLRTKKYGSESTLLWLDLIAGVAPLGQAIGRLGNYFNHENFGMPTTLPWGIYIDPQHRPENYANSSTFHPLFLYEGILDVLLCFLLNREAKNHNYGQGYILGFYLLGYSLIRFLLEFLKVNPWKFDGIPVAQIVSVATIVATIVFLRTRRLV